MSQIPIIDIGSLFGSDMPAKVGIATELGRSLHEIGFVGIQGHGLPGALLDQMREQVIGLFALPLEQKLKLRVRPNNYRGYIPLGFFTPNATKHDATKHDATKHDADQYEGYKLHFEVEIEDPIGQACNLYGPNVWPVGLPLLRSVVAEYWLHCDRITQCLLAALMRHLHLPSTLLEQAFQQPLTNMTLLHYPPMDVQDGPYGIHPHKDTDALTILAPDNVGGLFLKPKGSNEWIDASVPDNTLVVNVGDMLEAWSGGYFVSTPHKVVNQSGKERYSFPYFAVPRYDTKIQSLGTEASSEAYKVRPFLGTAGDISRKIWHSNWPDAKPLDALLDPYSH